MKLPHPGFRRARRVPVLTVAFAAAAVVGVTAVALGSTSPAQPTPPTGGAAQLAVLSTPSTAADALPTSFANQLQAWDSSASPEVANSRRVTASDGQSAYVVPTATGGICVINTNEAFCSPAEHSAGASVVDLCSPSLPSGQMQVEWLLPDNSTNVHLTMSDGSEIGFPSGDNVYITQLPLNSTSPLPSQVDWTSAGQSSEVSMPVPGDARTAGCEHPSPDASAAGTHSRRAAKVQFMVDHHTLRMGRRPRRVSTLGAGR